MHAHACARVRRVRMPVRMCMDVHVCSPGCTCVSVCACRRLHVAVGPSTSLVHPEATAYAWPCPACAQRGLRPERRQGRPRRRGRERRRWARVAPGAAGIAPNGACVPHASLSTPRAGGPWSKSAWVREGPLKQHRETMASGHGTMASNCIGQLEMAKAWCLCEPMPLIGPHCRRAGRHGQSRAGTLRLLRQGCWVDHGHTLPGHGATVLGCIAAPSISGRA